MGRRKGKSRSFLLSVLLPSSSQLQPTSQVTYDPKINRGRLGDRENRTLCRWTKQGQCIPRRLGLIGSSTCEGGGTCKQQGIRLKGGCFKKKGRCRSGKERVRSGGFTRLLLRIITDFPPPYTACGEGRGGTGGKTGFLLKAALTTGISGGYSREGRLTQARERDGPGPRRQRGTEELGRALGVDMKHIRAELHPRVAKRGGGVDLSRVRAPFGR